jgi:hypothetical protein
VVDINDGFQAHADPLSLFPFRRLGHYNEEGHRLVAETVLKSIARPISWPVERSSQKSSRESIDYTPEKLSTLVPHLSTNLLTALA